jgi:predicted DNA-binding transcriptional regulator AlpA
MTDVTNAAQIPTTKHSAHKLQPLAVAENPDALLQIKTAAALTGRGISSIYKLASTDPTFPKLIKRGVRCTRIRAGDLTQWLKAQANGVAA